MPEHVRAPVSHIVAASRIAPRMFSRPLAIFSTPPKPPIPGTGCASMAHLRTTGATRSNRGFSQATLRRYGPHLHTYGRQPLSTQHSAPTTPQTVITIGPVITIREFARKTHLEASNDDHRRTRSKARLSPARARLSPARARQSFTTTTTLVYPPSHPVSFRPLRQCRIAAGLNWKPR
jgi:hypothetical protein